MAFINYYELLRVSEDASVADIRKAAQKLYMTCHPDKVIDAAKKAAAQEKFVQFREAEETLKDEQKRKKYDFKLRMHKSGQTPADDTDPFSDGQESPKGTRYEGYGSSYTTETRVPREFDSPYPERDSRGADSASYG